MIDEILDRARTRVDKPTATLIVAEDPAAKRFIGEVLFTGAVLFLIHEYCRGYLEGIGFTDMAKSHGEKTRAFFDRLRAGTVSDADLQQAKADAEEAVEAVRRSEVTEAAKLAGESSVENELIEAGAIRQQARDVAQEISAVVLEK